VLDALLHFYQHDNANVHRGVHALSERATVAYEAARLRVKTFINASSIRDIVFVKGTTEAINLVAHSYGGVVLTPGDEIIVSALEHHANIVPWQLACEYYGAVLRVIPMNADGELQLAAYQDLLNQRTKLVALAHVSNALGTINPVASMIRMAHAVQVPVLLDGAQAIPHMPVDVQALDCDFYAFSGHKAYAPMGIGVLYAKQALQERMRPYQGGGDMIRHVSFAKTTYQDPPYKFEAGTPHVAGAIGLAAALDYLSQCDLAAIAAYEHELLTYATAQLLQIPGLRLIGTARDKAAIISFVLDGVHAHDIGTILDSEGIALRAGHHCAMPVMTHFDVPATARASFCLYNTRAEVDALVDGLLRVRQVFAC
jgi:cysteine desulfurase/selenocysteine lyase